MGETPSTQWAIAPAGQVDVSYVILGGSVVMFKLHNVMSGLTHDMRLWLVGLDFSAACVGAGFEWRKTYTKATTPYPLQADQLDSRIAWMVNGSTSNGLISGPRPSFMELVIWEGAPIVSKRLMRVRFSNVAAQKPDIDGYSTPNTGAQVMHGRVGISLGEDGEADIPIPYDLPDAPYRPDVGPIIPSDKTKPHPSGPRRKAADMSADLMFGFDSDRIKAGGAQMLFDIREQIERNPPRKVIIEGHTDSVGSTYYNQVLSERRANAVKRWLLEHGTPGAGGFVARGFGETKPLADNSTSAGRRKNRRVDVFLEY